MSCGGDADSSDDSLYDCWWLKYGVRMAGKWMIPSVPFKEAYFLEDALKFRAAAEDAVDICRRTGVACQDR